MMDIGVGRWVRGLADRCPGQYQLLALADSPHTALRMAGGVLPAGVESYQIDLMYLNLRGRDALGTWLRFSWGPLGAGGLSEMISFAVSIYRFWRSGCQRCIGGAVSVSILA